jgi:hypothetical protein
LPRDGTATLLRSPVARRILGSVDRRHVFISHSSKDRVMADRLCAELERRGISCWISSRDIPPGRNFQEAIVAAIRTAEVMILVFTSNANASDEIKKEVAIASANRIIVIPVRMMEAQPSDAFLYELATRQWIDVFDDWGSSIERLVGHLKDTVAAQPGAGADLVPATPPRVRQPKLAPWALVGVAVAGVGIALAASVGWWSATRPSATPAPAPPSAATPPSSAPYLDQYVGIWQNENPQTEGITRIEITDRLGALEVHLWGRCHPTDCDNGTHRLESAATGGAFSYMADYKFKIDQGSLTDRGNGELELTVHSHFTDNSRRPDYQATYRFRRNQG